MPILSKDQAIEAVTKDAYFLSNLAEFQDDYDVLVAALNGKGSNTSPYRGEYVLRYASRRLQDNEEVVLQSVSKCPQSFEYASRRLQKNKEFSRKILLNYPQLLPQFDSSINEDRDFILTLVEVNPSIVRYLPSDFLNGTDFFISLLEKLISVKNSSNEINYLINRAAPLSLKDLPSSLQNNKHVLLAIINKDPKNIQNLSSIPRAYFRELPFFIKIFDINNDVVNWIDLGIATILMTHIEEQKVILENSSHSASSNLDNHLKEMVLNKEKMQVLKKIEKAVKDRIYALEDEEIAEVENFMPDINNLPPQITPASEMMGGVDITDKLHEERLASINIKLKSIDDTLACLKEKISTINYHHADAKILAKGLLDNLQKYRDAYGDSLRKNETSDQDEVTEGFFKSSCKKVIENASPVLSKDLGWGEYLQNLFRELVNTGVKKISFGKYQGTLFKVTIPESFAVAEEAKVALLNPSAPPLA